MKVITISGSPRRNGHTAKVLDIFEETLILQGHEIERVFISDHEIKGCIGCYSCMAQNDKPSCILNDDALVIFQRLILADVIVYASPLYWFDLTAQLKSLFDRHFCLTTDFGSPKASSMLAGKLVALLITCAGPIADNADFVKDIFDRSMVGILKCNVVGKYIISFSSAPDFHDRAKKVSDKMALFMIIGNQIGTYFKTNLIRLQSEQEKCIHCNICTHKCVRNLPVHEMVQNSSMGNKECILCGACVDSCSKKAISFAVGLKSDKVR